jgi:hypothetical protein
MIDLPDIRKRELSCKQNLFETQTNCLRPKEIEKYAKS